MYFFLFFFCLFQARKNVCEVFIHFLVKQCQNTKTIIYCITFVVNTLWYWQYIELKRVLAFILSILVPVASAMNWTGASEVKTSEHIPSVQTVITFQSSVAFPECHGVFKQVRKDTRKSISNKFMVNLETETFKILFLWVFYISADDWDKPNVL